MKKLASILALIAIFTLTGCTDEETTQIDINPVDSEPAVEAPVRMSEADLEALELFLDVNIEQPADILDEKAFPIQSTILVNGLPFKSDPTFKILVGKAQTINYLNGLSVIFKIKSDSNFDLTFPMIEDLNYEIQSFFEGSHDWFKYSFIIVSETEFYVFDDGGFEGIPQHKYFNGEELIDLRALLEEKLGDEFAGDSFFPQFKITASESYLYFEEERYCCDTLYDTQDEDRANFKKTFVLDRETLEIVEEGRIER